MLTNKGRYGLKATVHLAGLAPGEVAQIADIAEANSISKKFVDQILTELGRDGLVFSKKGKSGGHDLAKPALAIPVGHIVRILDGPLAAIPCASVTAYRPCSDCRDLRAARSAYAWSKRATLSPMCSTIGRSLRCTPRPFRRKSEASSESDIARAGRPL